MEVILQDLATFLNLSDITLLTPVLLIALILVMIIKR